MFKKTIITMIALSVFIALPAFAKKKGGSSNPCKDKDVAGPYIRVIAYDFTDGYGNVIDRTTHRVLSLHSNGIAHQSESDNTDFALNGQARTDWDGSWACQADGSLVVTMMGAILIPAAEGALFPGSVNDLKLIVNQKTTYRFSVVDMDTLTLNEAVVRDYFMNEDPSDPTAGFLGPIHAGGSATYSRMKASDADLLP